MMRSNDVEDAVEDGNDDGKATKRNLESNKLFTQLVSTFDGDGVASERIRRNESEAEQEADAEVGNAGEKAKDPSERSA